MGGRQTSFGVLITPGATVGARAEFTLERGRIAIDIDGERSLFRKGEVRFGADRPGRVAVHIGDATLFFRPDRPADVRWLTASSQPARRLPTLGLEGAVDPHERPIRRRVGAPTGSHPEACEWELRSRAYGIERRVCRYCRAVSIDLTGAEQPRADVIPLQVGPADPYEETATKVISRPTSSETSATPGALGIVSP